MGIKGAGVGELVSRLLAECSGLPEFSGMECASADSLSLFGDRPIHIPQAEVTLTKFV